MIYTPETSVMMSLHGHRRQVYTLVYICVDDGVKCLKNVANKSLISAKIQRLHVILEYMSTDG